MASTLETKVKDYTDKQLLNKVKALESYKGIPKDYWILGVQSEEDTYNVYDDKFYLFRGTKFIMAFSGTTNAGSTGHMEYQTYNSEGFAAIKTNEWYYDLWSYGLHHGKMEALKQVNKVLYFRDWNKNKKTEEIGTLREGIIGMNFHTASYKIKKGLLGLFISGWSTACQVANNATDYYTVIDLIKESKQRHVTYCLLKEF